MQFDPSHHRSVASLDALVFPGSVVPRATSLLGSYALRIDELLARARTGWGIAGIPEPRAETISAHSGKVAIATSLSLRHVPDMAARSPDIVRTIVRGGIHDLCEWDMVDELPHDVEARVAAKTRLLTKEEKTAREIASLQRYAARYGDESPLRSYLYSDGYPDAPENSLIHQHDKLDAGVMALNYGELGYDVEQFLRYTPGKVSDPFLIGAFEWLLAREFPTLDYFYSYCAYLRFAGDLPLVREHLSERLGAYS